MSTPTTSSHYDIENGECDLKAMVAREGTELAQVLRERGWLARAGWRGLNDSGEAVWYVRFEFPSSTKV